MPNASSSSDLSTPIQYLKGVGPMRSQALASLAVTTVEDMLYCIPRRYVDRSTLLPIGKIVPNTLATVIGRVTSLKLNRRRKTFFSLTLADATGTLTCVWFKGFQYLQHIFQEKDLVIVSGKVTFYRGLSMSHPDYEILSDEDDAPGEDSLHMGRIIPIYPSTAELTRIRLNSKAMRRLVRTALDKYLSSVREILPPDMLKDRQLIELGQALEQIHFPDTMEIVQAARRRLSFNEFFFLEILLALKKNHIKAGTKVRVPVQATLVGPFVRSLPFALTKAQERVIREILDDMQRPSAMNRLLQGDVGSGKTIVAFCAMLKSVESGLQAALMAPTEVLAEQHFMTMHRLFDTMHLNVVLLLGGQGSDQKETLSAIATGQAQIVIGTHALFQSDVVFKKLGLIIIDEQHKFGVMQRTALYQKGDAPDVLVMTATPIPRTLSLTVYGDLDVSIIDEMPPGRGSIATVRRYEKDHPAIYKFIDQEIQKGHQTYIVYPLIEESEKVDLESAIKNYHILKDQVFPQHTCGLLHGRMKSEEKEKAILDFKNNITKILVSTTVIEVGVDVPNAAIMLVEHAERFGLAQLHQLRGRIGRGSQNSYCILCVKPPLSAEGQARLKAITSTTDGFKIAEMDLEIRGPGEFLGTRQSGLPDLKMANILTDTKLLIAAREEAFRVIQKDPELRLPEYRLIKEYLMTKYKDKVDLLQIG